MAWWVDGSSARQRDFGMGDAAPFPDGTAMEQLKGERGTIPLGAIAITSWGWTARFLQLWYFLGTLAYGNLSFQTCSRISVNSRWPYHRAHLSLDASITKKAHIPDTNCCNKESLAVLMRRVRERCETLTARHMQRRTASLHR